MKRVLLYLPALLGIGAYVIMGISVGFSTISTMAWIIMVVLGIAGIILDCGKWYGAIAGLLVAGTFIYMGAQDTGQILDIEMPIGVILAIYYVVIGFMAMKNKD